MTDDVTRAVRDRFDRRAATYDESAMHRGLAEAVADFAAVPAGAVVLDVATGTGLVLRALRDRRGADPGRAVGVDVSAGMLAVARAALPGAALVEADARALPLPDGSVDLVTCVTALHLVPDTAAVLAEWARVLRPGGTVVSATFAAFDPDRHHREFTGAAAPPPYPMRHEPFCTPEALGRTAAPAALAVTRHAHWSDGHDTLLLAELAPAGQIVATDPESTR